MSIINWSEALSVNEDIACKALGTVTILQAENETADLISWANIVIIQVIFCRIVTSHTDQVGIETLAFGVWASRSTCSVVQSIVLTTLSASSICILYSAVKICTIDLSGLTGNRNAIFEIIKLVSVGASCAYSVGISLCAKRCKPLTIPRLRGVISWKTWGTDSPKSTGGASDLKLNTVSWGIKGIPRKTSRTGSISVCGGTSSRQLSAAARAILLIPSVTDSTKSSGVGNGAISRQHNTIAVGVKIPSKLALCAISQCVDGDTKGRESDTVSCWDIKFKSGNTSDTESVHVRS